MTNPHVHVRVGHADESCAECAVVPPTIREAIEAEWYNGNLSEDAMDRILASGAASPRPHDLLHAVDCWCKPLGR